MSYEFMIVLYLSIHSSNIILNIVRTNEKRDKLFMIMFLNLLLIICELTLIFKLTKQN